MYFKVCIFIDGNTDWSTRILMSLSISHQTFLFIHMGAFFFLINDRCIKKSIFLLTNRNTDTQVYLFFYPYEKTNYPIRTNNTISPFHNHSTAFQRLASFTFLLLPSSSCHPYLRHALLWLNQPPILE